MKNKNFYFLIILFIATTLACSLSSGSPTDSPSPVVTSISTGIPPVETFTPIPTLTAITEPSQTFTPFPTDTLTQSAPTETLTVEPIPTVQSLKAQVTAERLSCRYGPGPEYLYLFALRQTANIKLVGRVNADNWNWFMVENQVNCWVSADFLEIQGDPLSLPMVYPGNAKLPITPYYPGSEVLSAERNQTTNEITISWVEVPISPGDFEDDSMQTYIIEVWRCEAGQVIFDPLATRVAFIKFVDEPGCTEPSHGQVWVQEKHGYAGPAEIPWPEP
ncbi:MAG: hypothetical protein ABIQ77_08120 [Anaerolineales bacterium]